ncbi:ATP-binding protein [Marinitenerispora sediminis]|uniref:Histidine kinase/HSP90-like ATPase domain-containing protein n=1 Tax=Marinitenerispora sediminis TaxID=1931232 RepID=A0A368T8E7_9ACTN|nr:ATP-binding protein [Marinitenerispora sediminis]RCV57767.1 hypothetical protein DEF28_00965 [Marinitenerispora sediminis]RCV57899.1 hypothetical protein DEF23_09830 [Marinitenerispora sediminis]RCV60652.1 hypothetical protein DEF24_06560 [Marinitenerispora sediminis]
MRGEDSIYTLKRARLFPGTRDQVREARWWARTHTRPFPDVVDRVELVISELFTNAVRHTASGEDGGTVLCTLVGLVYGTVHLEVLDLGPRSDRPKTVARIMMPDPERPGGCGLFLTAALTKEWGRIPAEAGPGYLERGYTSVFDAEPASAPAPPWSAPATTGASEGGSGRDGYTGPMVTWAVFTTMATLPATG